MLKTFTVTNRCMGLIYFSSPGFHEVFDLFACPLAIIEVLDDGVIARCTGQLAVLSTLREKTNQTNKQTFMAEFSVTWWLFSNLSAMCTEMRTGTGSCFLESSPQEVSERSTGWNGLLMRNQWRMTSDSKKHVRRSRNLQAAKNRSWPNCHNNNWV